MLPVFLTKPDAYFPKRALKRLICRAETGTTRFERELATNTKKTEVQRALDKAANYRIFMTQGALTA